MFVVLIHWRIKPDDASKEAFLEHWKTNNSISDRTGLIAEFVSDTLADGVLSEYITWHLDSESQRNFNIFCHDRFIVGRRRYFWQGSGEILQR